MRVLVTGVAGFIGRHLARALLEQGTAVVGVDNLDPSSGSTRKREALASLAPASQFDFVCGDVRDLRCGPIEPVDAVVHLAALAGVRPSLRAPSRYASVNIHGTLAVLDWCRRWDVRRLVVASSSSVYGDIGAGPAREDRWPMPRSPYAASKLAAELACRTGGLAGSLRVAMVRLFTVYGPGQRTDQGMRSFGTALRAGRPIRIRGDGSSARDYTHVADAVRGLLAALEWTEGAPAFEVVNLGSGKPVRLDTIVQLLTRACDVTRPAIVREAWHPAEPHRTHADLTKASQLFGYRPTVAIEDGVREFVNWLEGTHGGQRIPAARAS